MKEVASVQMLRKTGFTDFKFLFFPRSQRLIIAPVLVGETHQQLLDASNEQVINPQDEVIAGFMSVFSTTIIIEASGSTNLTIGVKDPTPVVDKINSLADSEGFVVKTR